MTDTGILKESDVASRFGKLKIEDGLKGLGKGDISLPLRDEGRSFIFQVVDREEGKPLEKTEALKVIRTRVIAERARMMARVKAEDATKDKGLKFTRETGFMPRSSTVVPGIGAIPKEEAGLFDLSKGQVFQTPVDIGGTFYVFAYADEKQPDHDQWEKDKETYTKMYTAMAKSAFFAAFKEDLRKSAKVKIDWEGHLGSAGRPLRQTSIEGEIHTYEYHRPGLAGPRPVHGAAFGFARMAPERHPTEGRESRPPHGPGARSAQGTFGLVLVIILGIDTSCDDTSAAVLDDTRVLSDIVSSQVPLHSRFGGVVPEIASRQHAELIDRIYAQALDDAGIGLSDVEAIAVTQGPGLIGSLLVGLSFCKGLALATGLPLVAVNHVEAHAMSIFLEEDVEFPFVSLVVSGGHSVVLLFSEAARFRVLGTTRDDAVGEAFDKVSKYLGLGYPGGRVIEELALTGNSGYMAFPRPMSDENNYDFSFSGLKTAFVNYAKKEGLNPENRADVLASFQEAACEVLALKTVKAARNMGVRTVVLGGGVASNNRLRSVIIERCKVEGISVYVPSPKYCTDNGAMVAVTAHFYARKGLFSPVDVKAYSRLKWS